MLETDKEYLLTPSPKQTQSTNKFSLGSPYDKQLTFRREHTVVQKYRIWEYKDPAFTLGSAF